MVRGMLEDPPPAGARGRGVRVCCRHRLPRAAIRGCTAAQPTMGSDRPSSNMSISPCTVTAFQYILMVFLVGQQPLEYWFYDPLRGC